MIGTIRRAKALLGRLRSKEYRDAYVAAHTQRGVAQQIRAMRDEPGRSWSQADLAARLGKPQSVVSRLENPSYGSLTVRTLLEVAAAFDVALIIKFVSFPRFLQETEDLSKEAMAVPSYDPGKLEAAQPVAVQAKPQLIMIAPPSVAYPLIAAVQPSAGMPATVH